MLEFLDVSHTYGVTSSVQDVNLVIPSGEVVSLLGPSGCGKSTIVRLAAGLEQPYAGEIYLEGKLIASKEVMTPPELRGIGLVFQDYALFPHMSVRENILYGLKGFKQQKRNSSEELQHKIEEALNYVDLSASIDVMPHELSGGEQQRVALARVLAPKPKLILLDEPYAGLDSRLRERIRDDMLHILKDIGTTVLLVTHDSEEAMFMSDHIAVMRRGVVHQSGRPIDLYCRPTSAFVAEFFGEVNRIDGVIEDGCLITPFGKYEVEGAKQGSKASMIIRYEGIIIEETVNKNNPLATVMETRLLGRYTIIHLRLPSVTGEEDLHLHARVPGLNMLSADDQVSLILDESQVFLFHQD